MALQYLLNLQGQLAGRPEECGNLASINRHLEEWICMPVNYAINDSTSPERCWR